jgi:hypothetical protein
MVQNMNSVRKIIDKILLIGIIPKDSKVLNELWVAINLEVIMKELATKSEKYVSRKTC